MNAHTKTTQDQMKQHTANTPQDAETASFMAGQQAGRDLRKQVDHTRKGQKTFAHDVGGIDSGVTS